VRLSPGATFRLLLAVIYLGGCANAPRNAHEIAGTYRLPWRHSELHLSLSEAGTYEMRKIPVTDSPTPASREVGVWKRKNHQVRLHPTANSYDPEFDGLRNFELRGQAGTRSLRTIPEAGGATLSVFQLTEAFNADHAPATNSRR
jgi:hypothetical protein